MGVEVTRTDAKKLRAAFHPGWQDLTKAQLAELDERCFEVAQEAFKLYEAKAKYAVVGQLYYTEKDGRYALWDPSVDRVCLGLFSAPGKARDAATSLAGWPSEGSSYAGRDLFRSWVLPIHHGSPATFRKLSKEQMDAELGVVEDTGSRARNIARKEAERLAEIPDCPLLAPDDDLNWVPCCRKADHPGACFPAIPDGGEVQVEYMNEIEGSWRPIALRGNQMWPAAEEE